MCGFDRSGFVDPIVAPGSASAHRHDFFGGRVTPDSTRASLLGGPTTCTVKGDKSGYWAPAAAVGGKRVAPTAANAYYRPGPGVDPASAGAFPLGWEVLAGHAHSEVPQPQVRFSCAENAGAGVALTEEPTDCAKGTAPTIRYAFPDCSDGRAASEDHYSHAAYSEGGSCPEGFRPVVRPILAVRYPWTPGWSGLALSSGPPRTGHADVMDGWVRVRLNELIQECVKDGTACGIAETARIANSP